MSKITFRADDDLVRQLEEFDASKSEVMREALRAYLEGPSDSVERRPSSTALTDTDSIDDMIADRVDTFISDRLNGAFTPSRPQDINVNISLDGVDAGEQSSDAEASREPASNPSPGHEAGTDEHEHDTEDTGDTCSQCGENVTSDHVYCPNCGEKATHRVFCDCGDELRSDWGFCPSCGRRTPAADVLDQA